MKQQALDHYDRMIAWAETQNLMDQPCCDLMGIGIGEFMGADDCSYCRRYARLEWQECPLNENRGGSNCACCGNLYILLSMAKTWATWIKYARKVRHYIEVNG